MTMKKASDKGLVYDMNVAEDMDKLYDSFSRLEESRNRNIEGTGLGLNITKQLVADKNAEGRAYEGRLPEGVNVQGVYIYGEFCPAKGKIKGGLYNVLSNETFTILAI